MTLRLMLRSLAERWLGTRRIRGTTSRRNRSRVQPLVKARPGIELLEDRTLFDANPNLPAPEVIPGSAGVFTDQFGGILRGLGGNNNTWPATTDPQVVVDPTDPQKLVVVAAIRIDPNNNRNIQQANPFSSGLVAAYSTDGGNSWDIYSGLTGNDMGVVLVDPTINSFNNNEFTQLTSPSVAFDRQHNFYVTYTEHNAARSAGVLVLEKFNFAGTTPQTVDLDPDPFGFNTHKILAAWAPSEGGGNGEPVLNPVLAINTTQPFYQDPEGGSQAQPQTDRIYVVWNTQNIAPSGTLAIAANPSFNPNSIKLITSHDGGLNFSTEAFVNDKNTGATAHTGQRRYAFPQINFATNGAPIIAWNDFFQNNNNTIVVDNNGGRSLNVVSATFRQQTDFRGDPNGITGDDGTIPDALLTGTINDPLGGFISPALNVNITDPQFGTVVDFDVTVNLVHAHLNQLQIDLIAPNGDVINLLNNRTSANTGANPRDRNGTGVLDNGGLDNTLGMLNPSINNARDFREVGTVFDLEADRRIHVDGNGAAQGGAAYAGHFRPEDRLTATEAGEPAEPAGQQRISFSAVYGQNTAYLNGGWRIRVYDFNDDDTASPLPPQAERPQFLSSWSLTFTSEQTTVTNVPVASLATSGSTFAFATTATPHGFQNGQFVTISGATPAAYNGTFSIFFLGPNDFAYSVGAVGPTLPAATGTIVASGASIGTWTTGFGTDRVIVRNPNFNSTLVDAPGTPANGANGVGAFPLVTGASGQRGIGALPVLAVDNTLGDFSPHRGRIYLAYVGRVPGTTNDTNIYLMASDDNGTTWGVPTSTGILTSGFTTQVDLLQNGTADPNSGEYIPPRVKTINDDLLQHDPTLGAPNNTFQTPTDNFSEGNRQQFLPTLKVDPLTGALVATWFDARFDAANARVNRFVTYSLDGGHTFSKQVPLDQERTARDVLDPNPTNEVVLETIPSNLTQIGNALAAGDRAGLAVIGGRIYAVWGGNLNEAVGRVMTSTAVIPSGPRIISAEMGPVTQDFQYLDDRELPVGPVHNNTFALDGTRELSGFVVEFDRPVDPASFDAGDVVVSYRNPNGTVPAMPSVTSITFATGTATVTTGANHGRRTGDIVTISGAAQPEYNGTFVITGTTNTTFTYTPASAPGSPTATPSPTLTATFTGLLALDPKAPIIPINSTTAVATLSSTDGTTATATTTRPHGLLPGESVVITGANGAAFNGTFRVASVPSPTTFTYTATGLPTGAADTSTSITAFHGLNSAIAGTITTSVASVNTATPHFLSTGDLVLVQGATPAGYNGTFPVTVTGPNTFTYPVPGGLSFASGPISIERVSAISALSSGGSTTATATTPAPHGLATGDLVLVQGASLAGYNGVVTVTVTGVNTFTYAVGAGLGTPTGGITFERLAPITVLTSGGTTTATATTATAHGLADGDLVHVEGATPAGYNGVVAVTVTGTNSFTYTVPAGLAAATGTIGFARATAVTFLSSFTSSAATVTTPGTHGLTSGDTVVITDSGSATFNGSFIITVTSPNTFTYTPTGFGTITATSGNVIVRFGDVFGKNNVRGATQFLVKLQSPQSAVGTYSYAIGPNINDRVRGGQLQYTPTGVQSVGSGAVSLPVFNRATTTSTINVPAGPAGVLADLNVTVNVTHELPNLVRISLVAPNGTRIQLVNQRGSSFIPNLSNTSFDDQAFQSVADPNVFFLSGSTFRPEQPLSDLHGLDPTGDWTLEVSDVRPTFSVNTLFSSGTTTITATAFTNEPHQFSVGDQVTISGATPAGYNGTFTITSVGQFDFDFVLPAAPGAAFATGPIVATAEVGALDSWTLNLTRGTVLAPNNPAWQPGLQGRSMDQDHDGIIAEPAVPGATAGDAFAVPGPVRSFITTPTTPFSVSTTGFGAGSITRSGSTVTVDTAGASFLANLRTGQKVRISGAANAAYNGVFTITVTGPDTFTYTITSAPPTPDSAPFFSVAPIDGDIVSTPLFTSPYDNNTLPLIVPGPHVTDVNVPGQTYVSADVPLALADNSASGPGVTRSRIIVTPTWVSGQLIRDLDVSFDLGHTQTGDLRVRLLFENIVDGVSVNGLSLLRIDRTGAVATVTTGTPHGLVVGSTVRITGAASAQYNGIHTITAVTATTFDFAVTGSPATPDTSPTLTALPMTAVTLVDQKGGTSDDFNKITFDDEEAVARSIATAAAPFTGRYRPEQALSGFDGLDPRGEWTLEVTDLSTGQTGTLRSWSLNIATEPPVVLEVASIFAVGSFGTAQVTTNVPHGFVVGQKVLIQGATPSFFNGIHTVTDTGDIVAPTLFFITLGEPQPFGVIATGTMTVTAVSTAAEARVLNRANNALDVTFDRDINAATFEADGRDVLRIVGPTGLVTSQGIASLPFSITGLSSGGTTTATANTAAAHGLSTGDQVRVQGASDPGYNGTFTVTVVTPTQFRYTVSAGLGAPTGTITGQQVIGITTLDSGGTPKALVSTMSAHRLATGDRVLIQGATPTGYNGVFTVTVTGPTNFTYAVPAGLPAATGTIAALKVIATPTISVTTLVSTVDPDTKARATATTLLPHGLTVGDRVVIKGASPAGYNGLVTITDITSPTSFRYEVASAMAAATGVITADTITVTPIVNGTLAPGAAVARSFRIGFPTQTVSGTYNVVFGSTASATTTTIQDTNGNGLDINFNAGLDSLRGQGVAFGGSVSVSSITFDSLTGVATVTTVGPHGQVAGDVVQIAGAQQPSYNGLFTILSAPTASTFTYRLTASVLPTGAATGTIVVRTSGKTLGFSQNTAVAIPTATAANTPSVTESTLRVTESLILNDVNIQFRVLFPNDPALTGELVHPDGTVVRLFTNMQVNPPLNDFIDTVLDDSATAPIQRAGPPYRGTFLPQQPLSALNGKNAQGDWKLRIINNSTSQSGSIANWSLTVKTPVVATGLGEPVADQASVSFRMFTMDPSQVVSTTTWTAVGPASENSGGNSSRTSAVAVDPSDPSGNTVYIGGASGGVWKTTNFLTTDAAGPRWVPLTDFGPSTSLNIGSIAIFPRNNDPNQSIIFAATGEGDTGTPGVGFLRSMDGGLTWAVLDSLNNVDSRTIGQGNLTPINAPLNGTITPNAAAPTHDGRDHWFAGTTTAFKIVVDPQPTPTGEVVLFAAVSNAFGTAGRGGIYRSLDSGRHWQQVLAGQATDIVFAAASADPGSGNLQILYAAMQGQGVFASFNQGDVGSWNLMTPTGENSFIRDLPTNLGGVGTGAAVPVTPRTTPNGNKGRITLAVPSLVPGSDPGALLKNLHYRGWVYALVSAGPNGPTDGIYVTKDFGKNWTEVQVPALYLPNVNAPTAIYGSNDENKPNAETLGGQADYDQNITVHPTNPNIIYVGGLGTANLSVRLPIGGLIRIDTTGMSDSQSLTFFDHHDNDGGNVTNNTRTTGQAGADTSATGTQIYGLVTVDPANPLFFNSTHLQQNFVNLVRDPDNPFDTSTALYTIRVTRFNNLGEDIRGYGPFHQLLEGFADVHRVTAYVDPLTGDARFIYAIDHGVFTGVDRGDGELHTDIGTAQVPNGQRNGNLQTAQFYYGAAQPSPLAAELAGAMFYGMAQDNGFPTSTSDVLETGDLNWTGSAGDGTGVAVDQSGSGTVYEYRWPCCGGLGFQFFQFFAPPSSPREFFPYFGVGRTGSAGTSLLEPGDNPATLNTGNWPNLGGRNFAINPANKGGVVMSSNRGRTFRTTNGGLDWFLIATQADIGNSTSDAQAYGAPDPARSSNLDDFIYIGTNAGRVFVTFNGTAPWRDLNLPAGAGPVQVIQANPRRGSYDVFVAATNGIFYLPDSRVANPVWQNLTGTLFGNASRIDFDQSNFGQNVHDTWTTGGAPVGVTGFNATADVVLQESTVVVTTAANHNLFTGDEVEIAGAPTAEFNGRFQVIRISATQFSIVVPGYFTGASPVGSAQAFRDVSVDVERRLRFLRALAVDWRFVIPSATPTPVSALTAANLSATQSTVTVTTPAAHGFATADNIIMAGAATAAFNGTFSITVVNATTFTYTVNGLFSGPDASTSITASRLPNAGLPIIYVGGEGGVYRSVNMGNTWAVFPDMATDGAPVDGGYLPSVDVRDLDLSVGLVDPATGQVAQEFGPNILVATTYGRGTFAIRLNDDNQAWAQFNSFGGPRIIDWSPRTPVPASPLLSQVDIQWDRAIDPDTFTIEDLKLTFIPADGSPAVQVGPLNLIDITPTPLPGQLNLHDQWRITFPTVLHPTLSNTAVYGDYRLVVGVDVRDYSGRLMNQDGDFVLPIAQQQAPFADGETAIDTETVLDPDTGNAIDAFDQTFRVAGLKVVSVLAPTSPAGSPLQTIRVKFNTIVDPASFSAPNALLLRPLTASGPGAPLALGTPVMVPANQLAPGDFPGQVWDIPVLPPNGLSAADVYSFLIGPSIRDTFGNAMDQDQDYSFGEPGASVTTAEVGDDQFDARFTIGGLQVLDASTLPSPNQPVVPGMGTVRVTFNMPVSAFPLTGATLLLADGITTLTATSVIGASADGKVWDVTFSSAVPSALTTAGIYQLTIGPGVLDLAGNPMNQNNDTDYLGGTAEFYVRQFSVTGLQVVSTSPDPNSAVLAPPAGAPFDHIDLTFNYRTDVSTFTAAQDLRLLGPNVATLTSLTSAGTSAATVTTTGPHGLATGDEVLVQGANVAGYNGVFPVIVTGTNTFTYNTPIGLAPAGGPITIERVSTITALDSAGTTTATATTAVPHGLAHGTAVLIQGASVAGYNGIFTITVTGANTFTYTVAGGLAAASGVITFERLSTITTLSSGGSTTATATTGSPHGLVSGAEVRIQGASVAGYNGVFAVTVTGANTFTYTVPAGMLAATGSITAQRLSTTIGLTAANTATATATTTDLHGLATGDQVLVQGATLAGYNGIFGVTVTSPTSFTYVVPSGLGAAAGAITVQRVTLLSNLASNGTITATATTPTAHGLANGDRVLVQGASVAGYNGIFAVTVLNSLSFSYTVAAGLAAPTGTITFERLTSITTVDSAGTNTATATTATPHGLLTGAQVVIQGATPAGYNGTVTITVTGPSTFTYAVPLALAPATGTVTAQRQSTVNALSSSATTTTTATTTYVHGLATGDQVVIQGASVAGYNGTFTVTVTGPNTFTYAIPVGLPPTSGAVTVQRLNLLSTLSSGGTATATATTAAAHGLASGNLVLIQGASVAGYNGVFSIIVTGANTFTYSVAPGLAAAGGTITFDRLGAVTTLDSGGTTTATVTTTAAHGLVSNDRVLIQGANPAAYNGIFTVTVTGANTFTYTVPLGQPTATGTIGFQRLNTIAAVSGAPATTATATSAAPHGLVTGDQVFIQGASPAAYNGIFTVTVTSPTTFTLNVPTGLPLATGTITAQRVIPVTLSNLNPGTDTQYRVSFAAQTMPGVYTLTVGAHIADLAGHEMNQDGQGGPTGAFGEDGTTVLFKEADDDEFQVQYSVEGLRIIGAEPALPLLPAAGFDHIDLQFNAAVANFPAAAIRVFNDPLGNNLIPAISSIAPVNPADPTLWRISFSAQTRPGSYRLLVGPDIFDPAGHAMNQDGDLVFGEPGANALAKEATDDQFGANFIVDGLRVVSVTPSANVPIVPASFSTLTATFNQAVDLGTFDVNADVLLRGPDGTAITITSHSWSRPNPALPASPTNPDNSVLTLNFTPAQTTEGVYELFIGPNIQAVGAIEKMDQDNDGQFGEDPAVPATVFGPTNDQFVARWSVVGLRVTSMSPGNGGVAAPGQNQVDLVFNAAVDSSSFDVNDVLLTGLQLAGQRLAVATLTSDGTATATATTAVPHLLATGDTVLIQGASPAGYNGIFGITVTSPTTFTFTVAAGLAPAAGAGVTIERVTPISGLSATGTTATATTSTPHGLASGDRVLIQGAGPASYNGIFTITVTGPTTFTYSVLVSGLPPTTGPITVQRLRNVTTLDSVGTTTATATTSVPHGLLTGSQVRIQGANQGGYNGIFTITVTSPTTFTYTVPAGLFAATGTITAQPINTMGAPGLSSAGTTSARAITTVPHGLATGDRVFITGASPSPYNGAVTVTVVNATTFLYSVPINLPAATGTITAQRASTIVSLSSSGFTTATVVTATSHGLSATDRILIQGASPAAYNGIFNVAITSPTTFTIIVPAGLPAATGSITIERVSTIAALSSGGSTLATATTAGAHGLAVNDRVFIQGASVPAYNGVFTVLSVPTGTSFTYSVPGGLAPTGGSITFERLGAVGTLNSGGGTTTATATTVAPHGLTTGDPVRIQGANQFAYNGIVTVTVTGANTFTYAVPGGLPAATGTIGFVRLTAVSGLSSSPTDVATVITSVPHLLTTGDRARILGANEAGYNGIFTVTVTGAFSFTYVVPAGLPAATGMITVERVVPLAGVAPTAGFTDNRHWTVTTAAPVLPYGAYSLLVGPHIEDMADHEMNQNGLNGIAGSTVFGEEGASPILDDSIFDDQFSDAFIIRGLEVVSVVSNLAGGGMVVPNPSGAGIQFLDITFNQPIQPASLTDDDGDIVVLNPNGDPVTIAAAMFESRSANNTVWRINFTPALVTPGVHTIRIGPDILGVTGIQMDQDNDEVPGEPVIAPPGSPAHDIFLWPGLRIIESSVTPNAAIDPKVGFNKITFKFNGPVDPTSVIGGVITITGPFGPIAFTPTVTSSSRGLNDLWELTFLNQLRPGNYTLDVRSLVRDAANRQMNQDGDATFGEPTEDAFQRVFRVIGLQVTDISPTPPGPIAANPGFNRVDITFNASVNGNFFQVSQAPVTLTGPAGGVLILSIEDLTLSGLTVEGATGTDLHDKWRVTFVNQSSIGTYTFTLKSIVREINGALLDQDNDGLFGENPQDNKVVQFTVSGSGVVQGGGGGGGGTPAVVAGNAQDITGSIVIIPGVARRTRRGSKIWRVNVQVFRTDRVPAPAGFHYAFIPILAGNARLLNAAGRTIATTPIGAGFVNVMGDPATQLGGVASLRIRSSRRPTFGFRVLLVPDGEAL